MRVSIKKHNRSYLERLAYQMECQDYTEVINYLLTELKRVNYSFGSQVNLGINTPSSVDAPIEPGQMAMSGLAAIADTDSVLERLVSAGLEEF